MIANRRSLPYDREAAPVNLFFQTPCGTGSVSDLDLDQEVV
jgi:hypothetical protein